jgi:hypothetical protein
MAKALDARTKPAAAARAGSRSSARTRSTSSCWPPSGARPAQGWLSNLHLGRARPVDRRFVMLGKTFKGMTDEMLEWQTRSSSSCERVATAGPCT